jgi:hypothetical protein
MRDWRRALQAFHSQGRFEVCMVLSQDALINREAETTSKPVLGFLQRSDRSSLPG